MTMGRSRFNAIFSGMSSAAKKVYEAVPKRDTWNPAQIRAELLRNGISMEYRAVSGCLNTLLSAGLVIETSRGEFQREAIRDPAVNTETIKEPEAMRSSIETLPPKTAARQEPAAVSALDRLDELSKRVAAFAATVSTQLKDLASDIADAAIDIQTQMDTNEQNLAKLKQLQMLLKSLEITN